MGEKNISLQADNARMRAFTRALLEDVQALQQMIDSGLIESGVRRIGAEQELFLIDESMRPAPVAFRILDTERGARFAEELALFNLEINLSPKELGGSCLSAMEKELVDELAVVQELAKDFDARALLVGILPTL
ncbi:MAG: hypothetical protein ACYTG6_13355, partial [Planctomycetota bacterium]